MLKCHFLSGSSSMATFRQYFYSHTLSVSMLIYKPSIISSLSFIQLMSIYSNWSCSHTNSMKLSPITQIMSLLFAEVLLYLQTLNLTLKNSMCTSCNEDQLKWNLKFPSRSRINCVCLSQSQ